MAWRIEESVVDPEDSSKRRILLKGYVFDTFFMKLLARVELDAPHDIKWLPFVDSEPPVAAAAAVGE